jgi:hypothetical protein
MEEVKKERKPTNRYKRKMFERVRAVKIKEDIYNKLAQYADEKGRLIQAVATDAVEDYLRKNF